MASPEDLEREISRLWSRLSAPGGSPDPTLDVAPAPASGSELAWETAAILKRQHARQSRTWSEMLEAKEQALQITRQRLAQLETELASARRKLEGSDGRVMAELTDAQARVAEAHRALQNERKRFADDLQAMRDLVEEARRTAAADAARHKAEEDRWQKREQQYLVDLAELQALAARRQEEAGKSEDQTKRLETGLKEAKNALEKTLAELLRERKIREESEKDRAKALARVGEVEKHFDELSRIWEEERAQWRELWDRERSTWESKRQELTAWEETLRKEREAWAAQSATQEKDQARYADEVTRKLRESADSSEKLAGVMQRLAQLETKPAAADSAAAPAWRPDRRAVGAVAAALALCAGGWWLSRWTLKPLSTQAVALESPTGLALSGGRFWLPDWSGTLTAFEPGDLRAPMAKAAPKASPPYRAGGAAAGPDYLWTIDTAQARILRHDPLDPSKILVQRPAPGPAPTALAFDGKQLWSYDAANKTLYRHGDDEGTFKAYALEGDAVPTAMAWVEGRLWLYDSKARALRVYEVASGTLEPRESHELGAPVIGLVRSGDALVALVGPSQDRAGHAVMRLKYARRIFTIF